MREDIEGMQAFLESVDCETVSLNEKIDKVSQGITHQLPRVHFDFYDSERQTIELIRDPPKLRFYIRSTARSTVPPTLTVGTNIEIRS
jgi:hypothetical protein